ncbi:AAA family ATPase [Leptolyngbya sp. FACHB-261]|uniref:AAA family ATPase n=1 Tax=Leptolyngbya sp. FACHB-261 TaxID=2692806 RepID=UPI0016847EC5|nr:AAA family ATPase [Leptolyngbya sp. FACHB-261]MBD2101786.1 AAA family ATPase [Leptolyngbya sp. FACHB-261]
MTAVPLKPIQIMPYTLMVGQKQLKLALELAFIAPRIGGVLLSGQRGTGKSTVVRAFGTMISGRLPVTLPINVTEDRVVGGWEINQLLQGKLVSQPGLLEEADGGLLYIDEVNLLDDHIVNILLDVTSTGVLVVEREGKDEKKEVRFTLVGTMNPSEGGLRPQLLDRFGLMVDVTAEEDENLRIEILQTLLNYDAALSLERNQQQGRPLEVLRAARQKDLLRRELLHQAQARFEKVILSRDMAECCVRVSKNFQVEGHRGDYTLATAARAVAALKGADTVAIEDIVEVTPLALQHRRQGALQGGGAPWTTKDTELVAELVKGSPQSMADTTKSSHS